MAFITFIVDSARLLCIRRLSFDYRNFFVFFLLFYVANANGLPREVTHGKDNKFE